MKDKTLLFARIRVGLQALALVLIVVGTIVAILVGGLNLQGNLFTNNAAVISGVVLFVLGVLDLVITEVVFTIYLKNQEESEEETKTEEKPNNNDTNLEK